MKTARFSLLTIWVVAVLLCLLPAPKSAAQSVEPANLRTEYLNNPIGIDVTAPRLSWQLHSDVRAAAQTAYRIQVASSDRALQIGEALTWDSEEELIWDSGKVQSNRSIHVPYEGPTPESRRHYYWLANDDARRILQDQLSDLFDSMWLSQAMGFSLERAGDAVPALEIPDSALQAIDRELRGIHP